MTVIDDTVGHYEPTRRRLRRVAAVVLVMAFGLVFHRLDQSRLLHLGREIGANRLENVYAVRQSGTTMRSVIGYGMVGALGAFCLALPGLPRVRWLHPITVLCACYFGWCAASILWSDDPSSTVRKTGILGLMLLGAYGVATRLTLDDIVWLAAATCSCFVAIGLATELLLGTFQPWDGDYRFGGTVHPNEQAVHCAIVALAAMFGPWNPSRDRRMRYGLAAAALVLLVLTKSRTSLVAMAVAMMLGAFLNQRGANRALAGLAATGAAAIVGLMLTLSPTSAGDRLASVLNVGRSVRDSTMSGRLPLWEALAEDVEKRPWVGYGYGRFWTSKRILTYSHRFGWQIPHAHNEYLDIVLNVGLVGLALYLCWLAAAGLVALARFEAGRGPGELFLLCLIVFALVNGMAESKFTVSLGAFLLLALAAVVALHTPAFRLAEVGRGPSRRQTGVSPASALGSPLGQAPGVGI